MRQLLPALSLAVLLAASAAGAEEICRGYGPQTPRDIRSHEGMNRIFGALAPPPQQMNLCNIHAHANAEHQGPEFTVFRGTGAHAGYACDAASSLSPAELAMPEGMEAAAGHEAPAAEGHAVEGGHGTAEGDHGGNHGGGGFAGVRPGDTIEVHWVYTSCDVQPGEGLGACLSEACSNPELRVEAQVFLLVNDPEALDFADFDYAGPVEGARPQPRSLPQFPNAPVVFAGSTTGPKYTNRICSPLQVTWSVRPSCLKLDISSLNRWAASNVFHETHAHGVRPLVTDPALLSPIN